MVFRYSALRFDLISTVSPLESNNSKNNRFKRFFNVLSEKFFGNNFWHNKDTIFIWQHCVYLVEVRRMNYNLTVKEDFENMTYDQGDDLTWKGHVAYQSMRFVFLNISLSFHRFSVSLPKVIKKTVGDLLWRKVSVLGVTRRDTGRNFWFRVSILHVTRCLRVLRMIFSLKGAFQFPPIDL